jgi:23S rRNA pseudouridine1911/1915/1917 synthase
MTAGDATGDPAQAARRFVIGPGERERVDKLVARLWDGVSRATVQRWIEEGRVTIDGKPCRSRDRAGEGSVLEVDPGPPPPSAATPDSSVVFSVLYEDPDLLVIDKPPRLVVHPARGHRSGTLVNGLLARDSFRDLSADPKDPIGQLRPGIVHRIDKNTSGVLVIAKNDLAREGLKAQLAAHSVERRYRALTIGVPRAGTIRTQYARHPRSRLRFTSRVMKGKAAVTHVTVLETLSHGRAALVECRLETGRTHQIRVHLLEQTKTPLLGDPLYRPSSVPPELEPIAIELGRQALHAGVLGFEHPRTGELLRFEAPFPSDLERALSQLRKL